MNGLDKFSQLVTDASVCAAILFNPATADFELVDIVQIPDETATAYGARGLQFAGCLGVVAGQARVALATPIEGEAVQRIVARFIERVEDQLNKQMPQAESVDWLQRLWGLKDTRSN
jgi:hypothetical protein